MRYGPVVEVNRYRLDLYPTSYEFVAHGAKLEATLLEGRCMYAMVAYAEVPAADIVEEHLALLSGLRTWTEQPTTDSRFGVHFPLFDPRRNRFFVEAEEAAFAMVQQNVELGGLVLWLSARDYPQMLHAYRADQKGA